MRRQTTPALRARVQKYLAVMGCSVCPNCLRNLPIYLYTIGSLFPLKYGIVHDALPETQDWVREQVDTGYVDLARFFV